MGGGNKKKKRKNRNNKDNEQNGDDAEGSPKQHSASILAAAASAERTCQKDNDDDIEISMMISSTSAAAGSSSSVTKKKNPLFTKLQAFLNTLTQSERDCFFSNQHVTPERRGEIWMNQADLGEELVNAYSWAIPDDDDDDHGGRCMRILAHFAPLVEMGCGKNAYWCRQMKAAGINVIGYDMAPQSGGLIIHQQQLDDKNNNNSKQHKKGQKKKGDNQKDDTDKGHDDAFFQVRMGGPKDLSKHSDRTLFLCYPDENDAKQNDDDNDNDNEQDDEEMSLSMGARCLQHYTGNFVIHVGEVYSETNLSMEQAPWGRSSSPEFQQQLATEFHCILQVKLPSWLHVRDTLSVWKRSEICTIVYAQDDDDDEDDDEDDDNDEGEEEEVHYRHVPVEERLPTDRAAPCVAHLLDSWAMSKGATKKDNDNSKRNDNHRPSSKKPKLVAKQHETQEAEKSFAKHAPAKMFSKEAGYNTPW